MTRDRALDPVRGARSVVEAKGPTCARCLLRRRRGSGAHRPLQGRRELGHRRVARRRILLERAEHHRLELAELGARRYALARLHRGREHVLRQHAHVRVGLEGQRTRDHLVEQDPERIDVGSRVDGLTARLLRRHVIRRPEDDAGARELAASHDLGSAEVDDAHLVDRRPADGGPDEEHVLGLEIAMHDVRGMRGAERVGELACDGGGLARREEPAPSHARRERLTVEQLHHEVRRAIVELAEVVDGDDRRMTDRRRRAGLLEEARREHRVRREIAAQHLHREHAIELGVPHLVDGAHAALTKRRDHLVAMIDDGVGERIARRIPCPGLERDAVERTEGSLASEAGAALGAPLHLDVKVLDGVSRRHQHPRPTWRRARRCRGER